LRCRENCRVRFTIRPSFRAIRTTIRYASATAISLEYYSPLDPGTVLAVQLQTGLCGMSCVRMARVTGARPEEGGYLIDCTLSPPLSREELEALLPPEKETRWQTWFLREAKAVRERWRQAGPPGIPGTAPA
jgi:hypothetical protein